MIGPHRNFAIVCNPLSGKGKPIVWLADYIQYLHQHEITFNVLTGLLPETLGGYTDLIILGGDGTVNVTMNHFSDCKIPVSVIPCGTGNDFAYGWMGKHDKTYYFRNSVAGIPTRVDVGMCNDRLFINGLGVGFDGWVVKRLLAKKIFTGKAAYYSTVVSLLLFYRESIATITCNGDQIHTELFMCCVANGPSYGGGFKVAPKATYTDGQLDVLQVDKISLWQRIKYLPVIEHGRHLDSPLPFIKYTTTRKVSISADSGVLQAHLDGEWMQAKTFNVSILPSHFIFRK